MNTKQMGFTAEQRFEIVINFFHSGLPVTEFCSQYKLDEGKFLEWKNRFLKGGRDAFYFETGPERYIQRIRRLEVKIERLELDNISLRAMLRFIKDKGI